VNYVFGVVTLVLAAAVVVLFAMLGELNARMGTVRPGADDVQPLPDAALGRSPDDWPTGLRELSVMETGVALVLSTSCQTCATVAQQLAKASGEMLGMVSMVISTPDLAIGEQFVERHALNTHPRHIDVGGTWVNRELDVMISPSVLVFRRGTLTAAATFSDLIALRDFLSTKDYLISMQSAS
jgi:hypothetical protein